MRIIAGQRRGHKIDGPRQGTEIRPTSDLVRESIFNIVGDLVIDRLAIDLFAGTGAIGLEALSRGASRAIFVDRDREAVSLIHRNIATLRYQDRTSVRMAEAYRWARTFRAALSEPVLLFIDPPYREFEVRGEKLKCLLDGLLATLPSGSAITIESGCGLTENVLPDFMGWDIRRYGDTRIGFRVISEDPRAIESQGLAKGDVKDGSEEEPHGEL